MSSLSLEASLRTCKVNQGEAKRIESDRFLNPNNAMCIPWSGRNLRGQQVCKNSFYTVRPGCNSASERVDVENNLRPQYSEYITLNTQGIQGEMYKKIQNTTGSFGTQLNSKVVCKLNGR